MCSDSNCLGSSEDASEGRWSGEVMNSSVRVKGNRLHFSEGILSSPRKPTMCNLVNWYDGKSSKNFAGGEDNGPERMVKSRSVRGKTENVSSPTQSGSWRWIKCAETVLIPRVCISWANACQLGEGQTLTLEKWIGRNGIASGCTCASSPIVVSVLGMRSATLFVTIDGNKCSTEVRKGGNRSEKSSCAL